MKDSQDKYGANQIVVLNIPKLCEFPNGQCHRSYLYKFHHPLPRQNELDRISQQLNKTFLFDKNECELENDVEVKLSVSTNKIGDFEANILVATAMPEEGCVYLHGYRVLPKLIEEKIGRIVSIQNQLRHKWIRG